MKSKLIKSNILKEKLLVNKVSIKSMDCDAYRCMIARKSKFKSKIKSVPVKTKMAPA